MMKKIIKKDNFIKLCLCAISITLIGCVSPVSKEEFLQDDENIAKMKELSELAVPDTEDCTEIKNFIEKDEITKKDIVKILGVIQVDPKAADTSDKLANIPYDYVNDACYVAAPSKSIDEYCSKKYYQKDNCISFLTGAYPTPMTAKLKAKMTPYINTLKEKEQKEAIKAWEKRTGCKYNQAFMLQGRWGVLQQISAGTLITNMDTDVMFRYAMQSMYGQSDVYLVVSNPEYKKMVDGQMFECSMCVGGDFRHDKYQQIGTYQYTNTLGSTTTVKKLKACVDKK